MTISKPISIFFLLVLCTFFSCQKETPIISGVQETPNSEEEELDLLEKDQTTFVQFTENQDSVQAIFMEDMLGVQNVLKNVMTEVVVEALKQPEIFGLTSNPVADTRTCGTSTYANNILTLDFGAGCVCPAGNTYVGQLNAEVIFTLGPNGPALVFTLTFSNDFSVNGYAISTPSALIFGQIPGAPLLSFQTLFNNTVTCTRNGNTTAVVLPSTVFHFQVLPDGDDSLFPFDPLTFLNNEFRMRTTESVDVTCTSAGGTVQTFDVTAGGNNINNAIHFQPSACGCFTQGRLRVNPDAPGEPTVVYEFGNGNCDNQATANGNPVTLSFCN